MSAVQFIPKSEARPGDRVRETGSSTPMDRMPRVLRLDQREGVYVLEGGGERFVPHAQIDLVLRPVQF